MLLMQGTSRTEIVLKPAAIKWVWPTDGIPLRTDFSRHSAQRRVPYHMCRLGIRCEIFVAVVQMTGETQNARRMLGMDILSQESNFKKHLLKACRSLNY